MAYLEIRAIAKHFKSVEALAGVTFEAEKGDIVALLGPSGCGKTTLLNIIAGFFSPDAGEVRVNGRDLAAVPPHRRDMAMVFQNYALFPHLTVAQNVGFGLVSHKVKRQERRRRIDEALAAVRLPNFGARHPAALSGGQQQRVALARALVLRPSLLLMDEPLSNLDTLLRKQMREEVRQILKDAGITAVLVTHDQEEALAVADRILLMSAGRIEQVGVPEDIYERPHTLFGARFMEATNFISAQVVRHEEGALVLDTPIGSIRSDIGKAEVGARVTVSVRPERIGIVARGAAIDANSQQNCVSGCVRRATYLGTLYRLHIAVGELVLIAHVPVALGVREGEQVRLVWSTGETLVFNNTDPVPAEAEMPA